jgi:spermidine synthase
MVARASLYIAVFVSGAVLLGVEIAASRVVAPYFGNSLYVWGALIGVVLTGLAIGYWIGGVIADRRPTAGTLAAAISLGAALVLLVPVVDEEILRAIVEWDAGPRLNPLLAAIALFGPLSVVLATVTPIAVRIHTRTIDTLGRTAGRLFAVSTFGSIAGTFATAFVLVPEFGTNQLLAQGAAALFAAVALVTLVGRLRLFGALAVAAFVGAVVASFELAPARTGTLAAAQAQNFSPVYRLRGEQTPGIDYEGEGYKVLYRKESAYHSLAVVEDEVSRYLRFDSSFQSGMKIGKPFETEFAYAPMFHLPFAYRRNIRDLLFIGLGGGSSPKRLWRDFPDLRIQAVEIDPEVVNVAYRFFGLPRDPRLAVEADDGRRYLARTNERWDVIAVDAYYSDAIPFHLTTFEFLQLVRERLNPGGILIANVIGSIGGTDSRLFRAFIRTYRTVFPTVVVHPIERRADTVQNLIVLAMDSAAPSKAELTRRWNAARPRTAPKLDRAIRNRWEAPIATDGVPVLTDDYAPTDALLVTP